MYMFSGGIRAISTSGSTTTQCSNFVIGSTSCCTVKAQARMVFTSGAACSAPTTQASNITTTPAANTASINWTNGNGGGRVVYVNTTNSFVAPTNGTNPTANLAYTSGQQCVFNGTGSGAITVTGLTASTQYFVRVYEYCTPTRNYITTTGTNNPNSFTTTAACTAPNGTVAFSAFSGVSSTATTTNVTYTNGGNVATGYVLLRNSTNTAPTEPASGTAVPSAGSTSFVSGYTVVGTSTTLGSSQAFNSTGLTASTTYYYWVVAYQNTNGPCWFTPTTQASNSQATSAPPATYCSPSITAACNYGIIDNFSLSNLSQTATGCSSGYTDYTGSTAINMNAGQAYTFIISTGNVFGSKFGFWLDLNSDGDFADANEFLGNFSFTSAQTPTGSITIPAAAPASNLRLRVIGTYGSSPDWISTGSCGGQTYGEAHDYITNISAAVPCGNSVSGFTSCFATSNFSLSQLSSGNGSVNTSGAPSSIQFTGPTTGGSTTRYQITAPATGTISFNYSTTHGDPTFATFGYSINGVNTPLTSIASSGVASVAVSSGDVFAFYGTANFGAFGTFVATISNFSGCCPAASCTAPNGTVSFGAFSGVTSSATTTNVTYTNGANTATGYVLLRSTTNTAPTAPTSGTAVPSAGSTSFVSGYTVVGTSTTLGSSQAFNSTGLTASTTYY